MRRGTYLFILCFLSVTMLFSSGFWGVEEESTYGNTIVEKQYNGGIPLSKLMDSMHIQGEDIKLIVSKTAYKMYVVQGKLLIKTYPVVFGFNERDDKIREGDGCTPEGVFKLRSKYAHNKWSKFIWIDYPNQASWQKFNAAKQAGIIPEKASIGGEVGIHCVPANKDYWIDNRENWTLGCISMKNKDVDDLYQAISTETILEVRK